VEPRHAVRSSVQAGFRAAGSIHQKEGRHQCVCRSFLPVPGEVPHLAHEHRARTPAEASHRSGLFVPCNQALPCAATMPRDGGRPGSRTNPAGAALAAVGGVPSRRSIRRRHSVHRGSGQGRQTHPQQVEPRHAVRGGVQAGFRAAGPVHQTQGRHQYMRGSVFPVRGARFCKEVCETAGERVTALAARGRGLNIKLGHPEGAASRALRFFGVIGFP
jgi:hypothetical protein